MTSRAHAFGDRGAAGGLMGALERAGVADGQPFILGADGTYDVDLNRFLRELPSWGVSATNSISAYARDIMLFCRFLDQSRGGKSIWDCDGEDLRVYRRVRLLDSAGAVSVGTWNRGIAALDKWVQWALYEGLLERAPFRYEDKTVMTPDGARRMKVNAEHESDPQDEPVRFVSFEDYLLWRNVGLRGELSEGGPDPQWRGRHGERNGVFADLLVHTGMRLGEASCLLVAELPPMGDPLVGSLRLASAVTKRRRSRMVFMPQRTLRAIHHYIEIERDGLIARCVAAGGYTLAEEVLMVQRAGRQGLVLATGTRCSYASIGAADRLRLVHADAEGTPAAPLWLWLGEDGRPLAASAWQSAFHRANLRCAELGLDIRIHPHTLRHTYAVHMLGLLLRETIRALGRPADQPLARAHLRRMLIGNPMRKLQLLLGHAQEASVYVYLDVLDEAQEIVLGAIAQWDAQVAALQRLEDEPAPEPGAVA